MKNEFILEGVFQKFGCTCGKCGHWTYPSRIYGKYEWSCDEQGWVITDEWKKIMKSDEYKQMLKNIKQQKIN